MSSRQEEHHEFKASLGYKLCSGLAWTTEIVPLQGNKKKDKNQKPKQQQTNPSSTLTHRCYKKVKILGWVVAQMVEYLPSIVQNTNSKKIKQFLSDCESRN